MSLRSRPRATWIWGGALVALATGLRLAWVLTVPTVPVSDFAMYRESANYLSEFGTLDPGFIYMPGFVGLLAWVKDAGGDLLAQKLLGVGFGALGAAGLFALALASLDRGRDEQDGNGSAPRWRRLCPCPAAATATFLYAIWPAGIAMASVVGTDEPAAALLVAALAVLVTLGPRRPIAAALGFGAVMGLAAWVRAVALPLSALAFCFWLARREKAGRAILYTALGVGATLVVLLPWGLRHRRQSGELYFTDDHGGITALIGANPNSEGTYTRALNRLFKDVTGRSVLDEPHRQTDRIAYAMARQWVRFEPRYALGLAVDKADRLFDPEHRLLYWPVFRPGVLVGRSAVFFAAHRGPIVALADGFGLALAGLALAGAAAAVVRRRWGLLSLLPFQLALAATYTIFFAEPRYRLPIEMLAFPFVALALAEMTGALAAVARTSRAGLGGAARAMAPMLLVVLVWRTTWPLVIEEGRALRARHRWAVTEVELDGRLRTLFWGPGAPLGSASPIAGAPNGVHVAGALGAPTRVRLELGGDALPAGRYALGANVSLETSGPAHFTLGGSPGVDVTAGQPTRFEARFAHSGGPLALEVTLTAPAPGTVWVSDAKITTLP